MKFNFLRSIVYVKLFVLIAFIFGCLGVNPKISGVSFYLISSSENSQIVPIDIKGINKLGIARVVVPDYLDGDKLVIFNTEESLVYQEYARWAEPLSTHLMHVIADNMNLYTKDLLIGVAPWAIGEDYDSILNVKLKKMAFYAFKNKIEIEIDWQLIQKNQLAIHDTVAISLPYSNFSPLSYVHLLTVGWMQISEIILKEIQSIMHK